MLGQHCNMNYAPIRAPTERVTSHPQWSALETPTANDRFFFSCP